MNLSPVFRQRFFDNNNLPLSGGKLYSYAAGTTSPQATYTNATGTANTNPVILDSSGYADVWLDPTLAYKVILKSSADVQIWSQDNITFPAGTTALAWNANSVYSQGNIVVDSSGQGLIYVSLINNNQNNALTNVSAWRVLAGNVRTLSASTTLLVTDDFIRSDTTAASLTHTLPAAATTPIGKEIKVADIGATGNPTTCNSVTISNGATVTFKNNGATWDNVGKFFPVSGIHTNDLIDGSVSSAKIGIGAVGASQIATASITQSLLAARATGTTVAAGGVAVSASCGASATLATAIGSGGAAVTNLSVTIATTGRPVFVAMVPDTSGNYATVNTGGSANDVAYLWIDRDSGTAIPGSVVVGSGATGFPSDQVTLLAIDVVAAGTHTYIVKGGWGGTHTATLSYYRLVAFEL